MTIFDGYKKPEINRHNIIHRYTRVVGGNGGSTLPGLTDAPPAFIEASALFLVSTFMGRNFSMATLAKSKFFTLRKQEDSLYPEFNEFFNLWYIILGKSRIGRKSVVMGFMKQIIRELFPELEIAYNFTPQALIKNLADEKGRDRANGTRETPFVWIQDECTIFFDMLRKADFMASTDGLLSKMYDCETFTESTITRGTKTVENPHCTSFLASTPALPKSFSEKLFHQGLLNRFMFVVKENEEFRDERITVNYTEKEEKERILITEWFATLNNLIYDNVVTFEEEARLLFSSFTRKIEKIILKEKLGLREPYFGNLPNLLKRLSGVYQIAEMNQTELLNIDMLVEINKNSVLWAITYLKNRWIDFEKALELMVTTAEPKDIRTDKYIIKRILSIIRNYGSLFEDGFYYIKKYELKRQAQHYKDFDLLIEQMESMRLIEMALIKGKSGPPGTYIKLVDELDD